MIKKVKHKKVVSVFVLGTVTIDELSLIEERLKRRYNLSVFILSDENSEIKRVDCVQLQNLQNNILEINNVEELVIVPFETAKNKLIECFDQLLQLEIKLKITPSYECCKNGDFEIGSIRDLEIEDLLTRDNPDFEITYLKNKYKNKVLLITGAAGSIGSEVARQISKGIFKKMILVDQSESMLYELEQELVASNIQNFEDVLTDIRNIENLQELFEEHKPDIIYHAAAYKHVPLMERFPKEAIETNIKATKDISELAIKFQVEKMVFVSTDKAIDPISVMGATKYITESYLLSLQELDNVSCEFVITRFGNVLGSSGSVIPLFRKQIKKGGQISLTNKEATRYFMSIQEACQLVILSGIIGKSGEIFTFDMGEAVRIYDIAKMMIALEKDSSEVNHSIDIIGLRPGEKLHEAVFKRGDEFEDTLHDKIKVNKGVCYNHKNLTILLDELLIVDNNNEAKMKLFEIVNKI